MVRDSKYLHWKIVQRKNFEVFINLLIFIHIKMFKAKLTRDDKKKDYLWECNWIEITEDMGKIPIKVI